MHDVRLLVIVHGEMWPHTNLGSFWPHAKWVDLRDTWAFGERRRKCFRPLPLVMQWWEIETHLEQKRFLNYSSAFLASVWGLTNDCSGSGNLHASEQAVCECVIMSMITRIQTCKRHKSHKSDREPYRRLQFPQSFLLQCMVAPSQLWYYQFEHRGYSMQYSGTISELNDNTGSMRTDVQDSGYFRWSPSSQIKAWKATLNCPECLFDSFSQGCSQLNRSILASSFFVFLCVC